jgi:Zn-dependent protease
MREFDPLTVLFIVIALVPGMLLHELAHGWVAVRMGDYTPRFAGRLTFNLSKHVDAFGTVIVPALLLLPVLFGRGGLVFGYMKPMPLNPQNLRNPDSQMTLIALAGMGTNLVLAVVGAAALRVIGFTTLLGEFLSVWVFTNVLLTAFHVIPVPPLDASKILARFLPPRARTVYESWEPYGALFVLAILFLLPTPILGIVDAVAGGLVSLLTA